MSKNNKTTIEKSPAFQFYPKDWLSDAKVAMMTPEIRGLYIQLLAYDWLEDGFYREDMRKLSGYVSPEPTIKDDWDRIEHVLNMCFEQHPNDAQKITNSRLQKERIKQAENREKRSRAGRESGKARRKQALTKRTNVKLCSNKTRTKTNSSTSTSTSTSNRKSTHPPGFRDGCLKFGDHCYLTKDEHAKLCAEFSRDHVTAKLTGLDAGIEDGKKKYRDFKNHYKTILNWLRSDASSGKIKIVKTARSEEFVPAWER